MIFQQIRRWQLINTSLVGFIHFYRTTMNVYKYAFPSNVYDQNCEKKAIIKATKYNDSKVEIVISDNGIGVDESLNIETNKSLGLKIVTSLVSQLRGKFFIKHKNDTEFRIIIPEE